MAEDKVSLFLYGEAKQQLGQKWAKQFCTRYVPNKNKPFPTRGELAFRYLDQQLNKLLDRSEAMCSAREEFIHLCQREDTTKEELVRTGLFLTSELTQFLNILVTMDIAAESIAIGEQDAILAEVKQRAKEGVKQEPIHFTAPNSTEAQNQTQASLDGAPQLEETP